MLLTITNTQTPATNLGFLLHKHPAKLQSFDLAFGQAHVFYSEATDERCTACLLIDVDAVGLVRNRRGPVGDSFALEQYVNDRPFVASSFLSVAIARVFNTALAGKSKSYQALAETPLPLEAKIAVLHARGGEDFLRRLFEPLGYEIEAVHHALDEKFPEWGAGFYYTVTLRGKVRLKDLLSHIYVLVPVLDNDKHYWVGDDEIEKLLRHGAAWLVQHPEKETIARRYLKRKHSLVREALARLVSEEASAEDFEPPEKRDTEEEAIEKPLSLNEQRMQAVLSTLKETQIKRVVDLGCGEGKLLRLLLEEKEFTEIAGVDVSHRSLEIAAERLRLDRLPEQQRARINLLQGSLTYRDKRLSGYDAATVIEVIEHLDQPRLKSLERVLFEFARPRVVVVTTPNVEYNVRFEGLPSGKFRHKDHRFEWTRKEFRDWANRVAESFGYKVEFHSIGADDKEVGPPTQMGVFALE